ncbi:amidohydrolase family protein [Pikeienuella piscinae]|uniref:Amidohydrolase family protein n=1 Tax=Pikeienuella piscinae TaxID=2748098 RepID=A0A7L5BWB9_9RHOB|nr:amidohydrolase family protein [Pikeienuella piscinae]QIE56700.1 amidohydrolase family protein [Pikeienuella piscinae]
MKRVLIRSADWVVAWDEAARGHTYLRNADVLLEGDRIAEIGSALDGEAVSGAEIVDGRNFMVMPGLVDIHSHLCHEPINKGYTDETGSSKLYSSNLYEYMPTMRGDDEVAPWQTRLACAELLMSGVTTIVDMAVPYPGWTEALAESGLRAYVAPMFRSARWFTRNGHVVEYDWSDDQGFAAMEDALSLVDAAEKHPSGRLSGMVVPAQVDTCTPELLRASYAEAAKRGMRWQTHAAQSLPEFHEITRRHGFTPIQWLGELGVLGESSLVGHTIFVDDHPDTLWHTTTDVRLMAETGATVAHCPTVFMRRGMALCDVGRYLRAGVKVAIGTDTFPHNMIEEMRHVGYVARLMAKSPHTLSTRDVFNAATLGGAASLGRDDIGRLAPGGKADLVMVDMTHPLMHPTRDPIRSLVYAAADRAVHTVYVNGEKVVEDGRALRLDIDRAAREVTAGQVRAERLVPERDLVAGRSANEMSPLTFPTS